MLIYKGKKGNLKSTFLVALVCAILASILLFFSCRGLFAWFLMAALFLIIILCYKGMVLKISLDETSVKITRPLGQEEIKIPDISFCTVHDMGEGQSTLYVFLRKRWGNTYKIRGVESDKSYEEIIESLSKERKPEGIKINFKKASKIPVALVENGNELKEKILDRINIERHKVT